MSDQGYVVQPVSRVQSTHRVTILAIDGRRVRVNNLEGLDGTPIVDVTPVLGDIGER